MPFDRGLWYTSVMIRIVIKLLLSIIIVFLLFATLRTYQLEHSEQQKAFVTGKIPNPPPNGFYQGSVMKPFGMIWLGKTFNNADHTGTNRLEFTRGIITNELPFRTYITKGLRDKTTNVLAIDYNLPQNAFFIRPLVDEIVEIEPGHYLGKLHVRIFPGYPFTLAYFELKK